MKTSAVGLLLALIVKQMSSEAASMPQKTVVSKGPRNDGQNWTKTRSALLTVMRPVLGEKQKSVRGGKVEFSGLTKNEAAMSP